MADNNSLNHAQFGKNPAETEALLRISQMLARSIDLPTILRQIVDASMLLIPHSDQSVIHLVDDTNHLLRPLAVARPAIQQSQTPIFFHHGEGIAGLVITRGKTINVQDTTVDERFIPRESTPRYRSLLVAPINLRDRTIGTLSVESQLPGTFTKDHERLLSQLGDQAALAIDRARVLQEEQEQRVLAETLREVSNIEGTSRGSTSGRTANLSSILNRILKLVRRIVPYEAASILMIEDGQASLKYLVNEEIEGEADSEISFHIDRSDHLKKIIDSGESFIIQDAQILENWQSEFPKARSWIGAPIRIAGQVIAILSVMKSEPNFYQTQHADRLLAFANQASLTIQNAQLFDTTQQRLREVNLLFRISQKLAESLDVNIIVQQVIQMLQEQFHFYFVQIMLIDKSGERILLRQSSDFIGSEENVASSSIEKMSIPYYVTKSNKFFLSNNVSEVPFYEMNPDLPLTKAELAVPLKAGETLRGVLDIHHQNPNQFREHDLQIIFAITEQLTLAVEKAILYENLQSTLAKEQKARAQLVQTEKLAALGQIVASVAHELNNPLQAIQNALYLINLEESLTAQARDDIQVALNESNRMAGLIARLRETYRPTTSEEYQRGSLNDLVVEVEKLINTHLHRNGIDFTFRPGIDLPDCFMIQDHIKQVILNICLNAVESMPNGGKLLVQTLHEKEENNLVLKITDTGTGIHPDVLPYIFDPFVTTKDRGTGLGLAITHDIVRRHGGNIEPESKLGAGTTFTVRLPLDPGQLILQPGYTPFSE